MVRDPQFLQRGQDPNLRIGLPNLDKIEGEKLSWKPPVPGFLLSKRVRKP